MANKLLSMTFRLTLGGSYSSFTKSRSCTVRDAPFAEIALLGILLALLG